MNQKKELHECKDVMSVKEESLKNYPQDDTKDTIFIIDCETGGLDSARDSLLDFHMRSLQSSFRKTWRFVPKRVVYHDALQINKLSWVDLLSRDPAEANENAMEILSIFQRKITVIGHNIKFDLNFINDNLFENVLCYAIDTKTLARKIWPGLTSYSLENLCKHKLKSYNADLAHTANYDCILCENLLRKILQEDKDNKLNLKWLAMELKNLNA